VRLAATSRFGVVSVSGSGFGRRRGRRRLGAMRELDDFAVLGLRKVGGLKYSLVALLSAPHAHTLK